MRQHASKVVRDSSGLSASGAGAPEAKGVGLLVAVCASLREHTTRAWWGNWRVIGHCVIKHLGV